MCCHALDAGSSASVAKKELGPQSSFDVFWDVEVGIVAEFNTETSTTRHA
jgi:hypothetical protein